MTKSATMEALSGVPAKFKGLLVEYHSQINDAVRRNAHHDHRRALLMDFLRKTFGIEVDEIELEKKIKVAEARGRIDAFYKFSRRWGPQPVARQPRVLPRTDLSSCCTISRRANKPS